MNINIAFNTIIYIMIFLFPGLIFRRAFFSGKFSNNFNSGNAFERLIWNILFSIISIYVFYILFKYLDVSNHKIFSYKLQKDQIFETFKYLYENKFPVLFLSEDFIKISLSWLFFIYFFSGLIGFVINKIIIIIGLEKSFSVLKFQNNWEYLINSNGKNNSSHNFLHLYYTKVDVKTKNQELFTGKLHEIIYDKDNKIEAITIEDAYKFYKCSLIDDKEKIEYIKSSINKDDPYIIEHQQTNSEYIYRKKIKGNLFSIFINDIENISMSYIKIANFYQNLQINLKKLFTISFVLIIAFCFSYIIWDFNVFLFDSFKRRVVFCITTPFVYSIFSMFLVFASNVKLFRINLKKYLKDLFDVFFILLLFATPYLYAFSILSFKCTIFAILIVFIICGFIFNRDKN
jgi:hypothetical protein